MDVGVWCPSRHYIDRLRVQLRFNLWKPCAAEMFEEIDDFSKDAIAVLPPETPPTPPPTNFTEAAQRLRAALRADWRLPASHECLRQAHEAFDQRLEAEVIQPLFRPAAPPHKRNLQVALMEASRLLNRLGPLVDEGLAQLSPLSVLRGGAAIPKNQLDELNALVRMVLALTKELRP